MNAVRNRKTYLVFVVVVLALATVMVVAMAQPAPGQGEDGQQRPDRGDRGRMMAGMMGMMGGSAMSVTEDAVFVLTGGMLLKYDVDTLELLAQAEIPRRERPPRGDRDAAPQ